MPINFDKLAAKGSAGLQPNDRPMEELIMIVSGMRMPPAGMSGRPDEVVRRRRAWQRCACGWARIGFGIGRGGGVGTAGLLGGALGRGLRLGRRDGLQVSRWLGSRLDRGPRLRLLLGDAGGGRGGRVDVGLDIGLGWSQGPEAVADIEGLVVEDRHRAIDDRVVEDGRGASVDFEAADVDPGVPAAAARQGRKTLPRWGWML
ncbi:hypothetical protein ACFY20_42455 [Streptomyces sp. NPDC001312]|uniref:hypothetical protein n=1 Tax=Streptomyces sp. NPDC001312 TaxID=3364561 RepID=UPI00367D1064